MYDYKIRLRSLEVAGIALGGVGVGFLATSGYGGYAIVVAGLTLALTALRLDLWQWGFCGVLLSTTLATSSASLSSSLSLAVRAVAIGSFVLIAAFYLKRDGSDRQRGNLKGYAGLFLSILFLLAIFGISVVLSSDRAAASLTLVLTAFMFIGLYHSTTRWRSSSVLTSDLYVVHNFLCLTLLAGYPLLVIGFAAIGESERFTGIYANPNTLGLVCSLVFPISLYFWENRRGFLPLAGVFLSVSSVILSQSRTSLLVILIAFLIWVAFRRDVTILAKTGIIVGTTSALVTLVLVGLAGNSLPSVLGRLVTPGDDSTFSSREIIWQNAIEAWESKPLLGHGFGTAPYLSEGVSSQIKGSVEGVRGIAASSYFQVLVESGIVGVLAFAIVTVVVLRIAHGLLVSSGAAALGAFAISGLLAQFTESPLFSLGQAYPWVYWFVIVAGAVHLTSLNAKHAGGPGSVIRQMGSGGPARSVAIKAASRNSA